MKSSLSLGVLNARIHDGDVHETICPWPDCRCYFPLTHLSLLLPPSRVAQFTKQLASRYVALNKNLKQCPRQDCPHVLYLSDRSAADPRTPDSVQCTCGFAFCWCCLQESHEPALCQQVSSVMHCPVSAVNCGCWIRQKSGETHWSFFRVRRAQQTG